MLILGVGVGPCFGVQNVFSPNQIDNLVYWHDVDNADSITELSNSIEQIDDLSGNENHLEQSTAGFKPTYTASAVNGRHAASFDDTNDVVTFNTTGETYDVTNRKTHTIIYSANPSNSFRNFFYKRDSANGYHIQNDGSDDAIFRIYGGIGDSVVSPRPSDLFDGNVHCLTLRLDNGTADAWLDGAKIISSFDYSSAGNDISSDNIAGSVMQNMNGYFCEMFASSDAKTESEILEYYSYSQTKWGVS